MVETNKPTIDKGSVGASGADRESAKDAGNVTSRARQRVRTTHRQMVPVSETERGRKANQPSIRPLVIAQAEIERASPAQAVCQLQLR